MAQYLLGVSDRSGKVIQNSNPNALRWHTWSAYVRDSWQVNPNLTLNLGARWEHYPFPTTDHGGVKLFNPETGNVLIGGNGSTPIDLGVDVGWGQIVPRFGLAYRWGSKDGHPRWLRHEHRQQQLAILPKQLAARVKRGSPGRFDVCSCIKPTPSDTGTLSGSRRSEFRRQSYRI